MTTPTSQERVLFKGGVVLTMDPELRDLPRGDVLVQGDRIIAVGSDLPADGVRILDASGAVILPGFVNAHQHAWLGLVRGLMPNVDKLDDYFAAIPFALGRYYRPQEMYNSTMLTSLSCLDSTRRSSSRVSKQPPHLNVGDTLIISQLPILLPTLISIPSLS